MTTLTKCVPGTKPRISVQHDFAISPISPLTYGGFIEHMGRCIYTGIYDPTNDNTNLIDDNGFRTDVLKCLNELQVPVVRWPGGNYTATYHWMDAIGPKEQRRRRLDPAWGGVETNDFGTDEFMKWCRVGGFAPFLCFNMGTGTLDEAMAWLEYCNSNADTYYANLRRQNGQDEPYKVKYWALGNETWGPWQVAQSSMEEYADKAIQWAKALKMLDPEITLVLCGKDGRSDWDRYVLQKCLRYVDMISIHGYTCSKEHLPNALAPRAAERAIQITASLIDLARIEEDLSRFPEAADTRPRSKFKPTICFDEWNIWDPVRAPGDTGAEERYDLSDMLGVAVWLNVFIRQSRYIGMATIAQSVNVISPLLTTPQGVVRQTTYFPLLLFANYMRGHTVAVNVRSPFYEGKTSPEWLQSTEDLAMLDVSAARDGDYVSLAVVNVADDEDFTVMLEGATGLVEVYKVGGEQFSLRDKNEAGSELIGITQSTWNATDSADFTFERRSFSLLRWRVGESTSRPVYGPARERGLNIVSNNLVRLNKERGPG